MANRVLLVGIGSALGDDQVGWEVVRQAADTTANQFEVRCAAAPVDLLDWLEGVDTLHVCDAVIGHGSIGQVLTWDWPASDIERTRFYGSHDLSLPAALALADGIGQLPPRVRIWGITIDSERCQGEMTPALKEMLPKIAQQIRGELAPR